MGQPDAKRPAQGGEPAPLALFDLDDTLLIGDTDVLWCRFLMTHGLLEARSFRQRSTDMKRRYGAGTVTPREFCAFFVSTLAGRSRQELQPWRERFLADVIRPRLGADARELVRRHQDAGHTVVLTTATNRYTTELTAAELGIAHLIATEVEEADGRFTGRPRGVLNMRSGKVERLQAWLAARGLDEAAIDAALGNAHFYSDSINDLPLLQAVGHPVTVNADERLALQARQRGWPMMRLKRRVTAPRQP